MKLPGKSAKQADVDIKDYYSIKPKLIWGDLKQQNPAFWWLCINVFFEYVRPQTLYPVIDILPYAQIALLFACIYAFSDRDIKWVSNPANVLFILYFIVVILSSVIAFKPSTSLKHMDIIINWVILYFLIITVVNTEKKFIAFLLLFFLVNFKMSQFGFRNFVTRGFSGFGVSGAPGWFKDSGDLGIEMIIFVSLSTAFVLALKSYWGRYKKLLFYLLPVTGLITVIATTSRGAQLGMVGVGIWFMIKGRGGIKGLVGILIAAGILYAILPQQMLDEYGASGEDRTSQARLEFWSFGAEVARDHPVLGVGYYNWIDYCNFMNPDGIAYYDHCLVAHNTYVTLAAEMGTIGVMSYASLLFFMFVQNARTRVNAEMSSNKFIGYIAHGLDGGIVGYAIATIFYSTLFYPMLYVQLAMTVALHEISKKTLVLR